jgi:hypothetical protein
VKISVKRIALALGAVFTLIGAAAAIVIPYKQAQVNEMMNSPELEARVIVSSAMAWQAEKQGCPTTRELEAQHYLDPAFETDPWGSRYLIECGADNFRIHSLGPDRRPNTRDDVWIRKPRDR